MVVLAIAILNKLGRLLVSRQFREMKRTRIEGLLAAFPKLLENDLARNGASRQHTFVESDSVRYVYQPVENLYVVLITNKASNIVQDLETLRLVSKILVELSPVYGVVDEAAVYEGAFDLLFAFDEVVDWGGYLEPVTAPQIRQYLEMYSHEERLAKMIKESKIHEAKEEMRRKAQLIEKQKQDLAKLPPEIRRLMGLEGASVSSVSGAAPVSTGAYSTGTMQGFGPRDLVGSSGSTIFSEASTTTTLGSATEASSSSSNITVSAGGRGLALGKSRTTADDWMARMRAEGELGETPSVPQEKPTANATVREVPGAAQSAARPTEPAPSMAYSPASAFHLTLEEKLSAHLSRDGGLESLEVRGELLLQISDPELASVRIYTNPLPASIIQTAQLRLHPMLDKALWQSEWTLAQRSPERPFPHGSPTPASLIKWRLQTNDERLLPLSFNCWPTVSSDETVMNVEYEMPSRSMVADITAPAELNRVTVRIPLPEAFLTSSALQISRVDGSLTLDTETNAVLWELPPLRAPCSGGVEFSLPQAVDIESMFPIQVQASTTQLYINLEILRVELVGKPPLSRNKEVQFTQERRLVTDKFQVS
ncbi:Coatomer subunit delta [Cyanidiococcus yangmingshanensis]|uniref:Coatomer subunit delta n=1 Tax=Cyanidiococcus yangmingshanensis TaxID=2690220 RepID=A0A7J7IN73_9RHOD|nr:Coatomer subunit delta [Cyanidiococcus yangmingshanensis]